MSALHTIAIRRIADGATACEGACADKAFGRNDEPLVQALGFGRVFAGAKSDEPLACVSCATAIEVKPSDAAFSRSLAPWVRYECSTGRDVGAIAAFARYGAVNLELTLSEAWDAYLWSQPEPREQQARAPDDDARWALLERVMVRRCDLYFYVLADGRTTSATLARPPQGWIARMPLTTFPEYVSGGSDVLRPEVARQLERSFQRAAALAAGDAFAIPVLTAPGNGAPVLAARIAAAADDSRSGARAVRVQRVASPHDDRVISLADRRRELGLSLL